MTAAVQHTIAPWFAVFNGTFWEVRTDGDKNLGEKIGDCCASKFHDLEDGSSTDNNPVAESNARLFAAAPELLNALREAEAGLEFAGAAEMQPTGDFVPTPLLALRIVRAAIAKATGSAP